MNVLLQNLDSVQLAIWVRTGDMLRSPYTALAWIMGRTIRIDFAVGGRER